MRNRFTATAIIVLTLLLSCSDKKNNIEGVWLPYALQTDKESYSPWLKAHHYGKDHLYYGAWLNEDAKAINKQSWFEYENYLQIATDSIPKTVYQIDNNNVMIWGSHNKYYYQKALATDLYASPIHEITLLLKDKYWQNKDEILYFDSNGLMKSIGLKNNTYRTFCWENKNFENYPLLLRYGNHINCEGFPQYPSQIIKLTSNELWLNCFIEGEIKTIKYTVGTYDEDSFEKIDFQLCNKYIDIHNRFDRYYYTGTRYQGGLYEIRKFFKKHYIAPVDNHESGLIRVRFVVNCEGKAGLFESLELDKDYRQKSFHKDISTQIFMYCQQLQEWIPGERQGHTIDTYRFLTFRIENGEISEIFP